ncbi:HD domain-containing protein [bacterium]|nr:HD domain-containing protein [bacterium]
MTEKEKSADSLKELGRALQAEEDARLSSFATPHAAATRKRPIEDSDFRSAFARDRDRILYSGGFRRYVGKTQVVYFASQFDEHITNRAIHTLQVSQIGRTLGRLLRLNPDLIEAISLGHDLGHPPFGHDGEQFMDELCHEFGLGHFQHNVHGLYYVEHVANGNRGLNLTLQVRDGMLHHDGESLHVGLAPQRGRDEAGLEEYVRLAAEGECPHRAPTTLEGCLVRLCDTVSYLGQDVEDAIRLRLVLREELPAGVRSVLGASNRDIINSFLSDIALQSQERDEIRMSGPVAAACRELRQFNYGRIYSHPEIRREKQRIRGAFRSLFEHFLREVERDSRESIIFPHYLNNRSEEYLSTTSPAAKVRDYLATMTDRYFTHVFSTLFVPRMPF